jgi:4-hydroxy-tetrahydrodipicolinate synthase
MTGSLSTYCCTVTCFDAGGQIDDAAMRAHCARVADAGVGLYVGSPSPGEGATLTSAELAHLLVLAKESVGGRVAVRAMGVEPRHTAEMTEFVAVAVEAKVDAVQIYSLDVGHGVKPAPAELEAYFREVLDCCSLPAVLSSHFFAGYLIPIDLIETLARDYENLIGVNISTPDILYLSEAIDRLSPRLEIHIGGPMNTITVLALGGNGYLSTESNIAPKLCQEVVEHFAAGRMQQAFASYAAVMALMRAVNTMPTASVRRVKAAMRILGRTGTGLRKPYAPLRDEELIGLRQELAAVGRRYDRPELLAGAGTKHRSLT